MTDSGNLSVGVNVDTRAFQEAMSRLEDQSRSLGTTLTTSLRQAAVQGRDLEGVLKSLALRISTIALNAGLKPLESLIGNSISNLTGSFGAALGFAKGGVPGGVTPFADGGVVRSPTFFPDGSRLGLMGEAGSEAILPLSRGSDGKLGVAVDGSPHAAPIVFNVTTPDAASFRKSEAQVTTMLARAVSRGRRGL